LDVKKRFSEEQIIGFLREAERGVAVKDLCRRHGFSEGQLLPVAQQVRWDLKALESENARLKKLLAESMLENEVSREALRKKW
jgi:putative transposase